MQKIAALAALLPLVAAHGHIISPPSRKPGSAFEAACGQQPFDQQSADINGNIQGILQVVGSDFDAAKCNLWLCKGFLLADGPDNVQSYKAGESVDFKIDIAAPHTGYANVSVVKTSSNSIIGSPLIEFENYASNAGVAANNTAFSVTIPNDLGSDCSTAGDCVLQWFWNAPDINQTYEGCVDFTLGGSSSGGSSGSTAAAAVSSAAATSAPAKSSVAAVAETSVAATTPLAAVTQTGAVSTPAAGTPSAPASTPSDASGDDDDCGDEGDDNNDDGSDDDCDDEGNDGSNDGDDDDCDEETSAVESQAAVTVTTEIDVGVKATSVVVAAAASSSAAGSVSGSTNNGQSSGKGSKGSSAVTSYVTVAAATETHYVIVTAEVETHTVTVTADAPACT